MKFWSKFALVLVMGVCLFGQTGIGQTAPVGKIDSAAVPQAPPAGAPTSVASVTPKSDCTPGPAWLCITQTLQPLIFNPDGSHRPDADIAVDIPKAISKLTNDGVITPQNTPAGPIRNFEEAQKYLDTLASLGSADTAEPPPPAAAPKAPPCPKDQPWLCETPTSTPIEKSVAPTASAPAPIPTPIRDQTTPGAAESAAATAPLPKVPELPPYVLGINDVIQVVIFDETHISGTYTIGPDGRISMAMIGSFTVNGYTIPQLEKLLTQKLHDDAGILEPVVNVQLLRSNSKQYTLMGGFARTGPVPLLRDTTILDAIAAAGEFKEFADKKHVILRRGTKEYKFDYTKVVKGQNQDQNIKLEDGDVLYVKE